MKNVSTWLALRNLAWKGQRWSMWKVEGAKTAGYVLNDVFPPSPFKFDSESCKSE